jgi:hypothetical protein
LTPAERRQRDFETLQSIVRHDRRLDPIRGQWVAQLASKYEGVRDTTQQPRPFTVSDILAEVRALRSNPSFGAPVRVVLQGDWANSTPGPTPLWVTFADIDAGSRSEVAQWCESHFSQRGQALLRVCYPRQMIRK